MYIYDWLKHNSMVYCDYVHWGSQVVLASKTYQECIPWWDFILRLWISYRWLNCSTHPFEFPLIWSDESTIYIVKAWYLLSVDMDSI